MITNTGLILKDRSGRGGLNDFSYILNPDGRLKQLVPSLPGEDPKRIGYGVCMAASSWNPVPLLHENSDARKGRGPLPVGFEIIGTGAGSRIR